MCAECVKDIKKMTNTYVRFVPKHQRWQPVGGQNYVDIRILTLNLQKCGVWGECISITCWSMRIVTGNYMGNKMKEDELCRHAAHMRQVRNLYRTAAKLERVRLLVGSG